ncbi:Hypothetical protein D9617_5g069530 [Elsinoe fawcettii]|nr:Hypothetical protein D9617_5g069530 [Elsinoe fawcettii]
MSLPFRPLLTRGPPTPAFHSIPVSTKDANPQLQSRLLSLPPEVQQLIWAHTFPSDGTLLRLEQPTLHQQDHDDIFTPPYVLKGYFTLPSPPTDDLLFETWHSNLPLLPSAPCSPIGLLLSCKVLYTHLLPLLFSLSLTLTRISTLLSLPLWLSPSHLSRLTTLHLYLSTSELYPEQPWEIEFYSSSTFSLRQQESDAQWDYLFNFLSSLPKLRCLALYLRVTQDAGESWKWPYTRASFIAPMQRMTARRMESFKVFLSCVVDEDVNLGKEVEGCDLRDEREVKGMETFKAGGYAAGRWDEEMEGRGEGWRLAYLTVVARERTGCYFLDGDDDPDL